MCCASTNTPEAREVILSEYQTGDSYRVLRANSFAAVWLHPGRWMDAWMDFLGPATAKWKLSWLCFVFGERSGWLQGINQAAYLSICLSVVPVAEYTGWGNPYGIPLSLPTLESSRYYPVVIIRSHVNYDTVLPD